MFLSRDGGIYIYIHIYIFIYTSKYTNVHALNKGEQLVVSNRAIGLADFFWPGSSWLSLRTVNNHPLLVVKLVGFTTMTLIIKTGL